MLYTNLLPCKARAWAFRWHSAAAPGEYVITVMLSEFAEFDFCENLRAIVDDFGNLVRVPA